MGLVVINRIVCEEVTKEMSVAFYHCLEGYRKYKKVSICLYTIVVLNGFNFLRVVYGISSAHLRVYEFYEGYLIKMH